MVLGLTLWPLLLPVAAFSGWWAALRSVSRRRKTLQQQPVSRQYFVGLNYLLNDSPDKAVDVFIKLLEVDSDTVETHLALGSLFRRRGEVDRAIRIHQNLIARPQLAPEQHLDALLALGCDYLVAGVLDRAERIFSDVAAHKGDHKLRALENLLAIYQQEKAWGKAIAAADQLAYLQRKPQGVVIAHFYCELAQEALGQQDVETASRTVKQALQADPDSVRASLLQADILVRNREYKSAIKAYKHVREQAPDFLSETIKPLWHCYSQLQKEASFYEYLEQTLREHPRVAIVLALAEKKRTQEGVDAAINFVTDYLHHHPSLRGLQQLITWYLSLTTGVVRDKLLVLHDVTQLLINDKPHYRCETCGFSLKKLHWHCPSCKSWGTVKPIHGLEGD